MQTEKGQAMLRFCDTEFGQQGAVWDKDTRWWVRFGLHGQMRFWFKYKEDALWFKLKAL